MITTTNAQTPTKDVITQYGTIKGYLSNGMTGYEFRGIKYSNPFTRWEHTTVQQSPFGHFDAKNDVPGCPQECHLPPHTCPMRYDELDCLGLNIFTPLDVSFDPSQKVKSSPSSEIFFENDLSKTSAEISDASDLSPNQLRPVMVYFPGGNYFQGGNDTPLYNGTSIANIGGTIVVVVNYRLGILGYYRDEENGIFGNYGIVDQINALKWVQTNIKSFGGDPNNVTIFGQSAGGGSTSIHLISKYSEGLFHKAIVHSNPFAIPFRSIKTKSGLIKAYRKHTSCTTRECLLGLSTDQIVAAQVLTATDLDAASGNMLSVFIPFNPYVETPGQEQPDPQYPGLVPYQPQEAFLRGLVKNVPIMIGAVKQESDVFIYEAFDKDLDKTGYGLFGWLIFGDAKNKRIQQRYPPIDGDNRDGLCTIGTEFIFQCATRNATRGALSTSVRQPLYSYVFDHIFDFNNEMWGPEFPACSGKLPSGKPPRVCHAGELPGLWNSAQWMFKYSEKDQQVANQVDYFWTNFAWTGNPNQGPNQNKLKVSWESYSASGRSMYIDKDGSHMVGDYMGDACNFWDSIGYFL